MKQKLLHTYIHSVSLRTFLLLAIVAFTLPASAKRLNKEKEVDGLFVAVMRTQGNHRDINFHIMNLVYQPIVLVDATRPRLWEHEMSQMLNLPSSCSWMFLQLNKHSGYLSDGRLITTLLDFGQFRLCSLGEKNNVSHDLQRINHGHDILLAGQPRKLGFWTMNCSNVLLNSLHITRVCKEWISRRANDKWVNTIRWLQQLTCQPLTIALREGKSLKIAPYSIQCES